MQAIQDEIVGDYSPFVDSCILSVRDFGDGEVEVRVQKSAHLVKLSGAPCSSGVVARKARREVGGHYDETGQWVGDDPALVAAARAEKDAENRARAARRARQTVLHRIKTIKADRLLTLTYRENMQDRERLHRDWQAFVRRLRKVQGFEYVAVVERQKRGAFHIHVAIRGRQNYRLLRSVWRSVVGADNGNIDVRNPFRERALRHKLGAYLAKYVGKSFADQDEAGARRVWCSQGIERPERQVWGFPWVSWFDAVDRVRAVLPQGSRVLSWFCERRDFLSVVSTLPV